MSAMSEPLLETRALTRKRIGCDGRNVWDIADVNVCRNDNKKNVLINLRKQGSPQYKFLRPKIQPANGH